MKSKFKFIFPLISSVLTSLALISCSNEPLPTVITPNEVSTSININSTVDPIPQSNSVDGTSTSGKWIPSIIDTDPDNEIVEEDFDDSIKYDYSNLTFNTVSGAFSSTEGKHVSTANSSIAVASETPFRYGTISCDLMTNNTSDSGIVFGLTSLLNNYWEGAGIEYYFYFLSKDGYAYLGKTSNGNWTELKSVKVINAVQENVNYKLKVVFKSNKICCYFNDSLVFGCCDYSLLKGTSYGIRAGSKDVSFSNYVVTNDYLY